MQVLLANHSSYPREAPDAADADRGGPLAGMDDALIGAAVREQEEAGLDVVTDGQVGWADPVSHLVAALRGVRLGEPRRWLDTEITFRQPVIEAKLRPSASRLADEYRCAHRAARRQVKPVLIGPYTLARLSAIATTAYRDVRALSADMALFLAAEIRALVGAGARLVQVDEPLILRHPEDVRWLREVLEPLQDAAAGAAAIAVATYGGDAEPLYAQLNSLPGDIVALDCSSSPAIIDAIASTGAGKPLALGLVDGRSARLEDPGAVARTLDRMLHRYVHDAVYLQPSCGLASLTREEARAKLGVLRGAREALGQRRGSAPP